MFFCERFLQNVHTVCCSYNADMLPDLLAEQTNGSWNIYVANVRKGFVHLEPLSRSPLTLPHSCAFIDLLEEYAAGAFTVFIQTLTCSLV